MKKLLPAAMLSAFVLASCNSGTTSSTPPTTEESVGDIKSYNWLADAADNSWTQWPLKTYNVTNSKGIINQFITDSSSSHISTFQAPIVYWENVLLATIKAMGYPEGNVVSAAVGDTIVAAAFVAIVTVALVEGDESPDSGDDILTISNFTSNTLLWQDVETDANKHYNLSGANAVHVWDADSNYRTVFIYPTDIYANSGLVNFGYSRFANTRFNNTNGSLNYHHEWYTSLAGTQITVDSDDWRDSNNAGYQMHIKSIGKSSAGTAQPVITGNCSDGTAPQTVFAPFNNSFGGLITTTCNNVTSTIGTNDPSYHIGSTPSINAATNKVEWLPYGSYMMFANSVSKSGSILTANINIDTTPSDGKYPQLMAAGTMANWGGNFANMIPENTKINQAYTLDMNTCAANATVSFINGQLSCDPMGQYLQNCNSLRWDGTTLSGMCQTNPYVPAQLAYMVDGDSLTTGYQFTSLVIDGTTCSIQDNIINNNGQLSCIPGSLMGDYLASGINLSYESSTKTLTGQYFYPYYSTINSSGATLSFNATRYFEFESQDLVVNLFYTPGLAPQDINAGLKVDDSYMGNYVENCYQESIQHVNSQLELTCLSIPNDLNSSQSYSLNYSQCGGNPLQFESGVLSCNGITFNPIINPISN